MATHKLTISAPARSRPPAALLKQVLLVSLRVFGGTWSRRTTETSLAFVTDTKMAALNKRYRGKRGTTNVLSFSLATAAPAASSPYLGEIVISRAQAVYGARAHGHSVTTEIALLFLHGLLHVLGFDHEKGSAGLKKMQRAEDAVIARIPALKKAAKGKGLIVRELVYPT